MTYAFLRLLCVVWGATFVPVNPVLCSQYGAFKDHKKKYFLWQSCAVLQEGFMIRSRRRRRDRQVSKYRYLARKSVNVNVIHCPHWDGNFRLSPSLHGLHIQSGDNWSSFDDDQQRSLEAMGVLFKHIERLLPRTDHGIGRSLDILESFLLTYHNIRRVTNHTDFMVQMMILFKLVYGGQRIATLNKWFAQINSFFKTDLDSPVQSRETVMLMRSYFDGVSSCVNNPLFKKSRKLFSFLLTQGLLSQFGISLSEEDFSRYEIRNYQQNYSSKVDLWWCILDTSITILERVEDYKVTGKFSDFIHGRDKYTEWLDKTDRLLALAPFTGNLEAHGTNAFTFRAEVAEQIEIGRAMILHTKTMTNTTNSMIVSKYNQLQLLQATEVTRKAAQQERQAPYGVLVNGKSSIGKSSFTKMLYYYFGKLLDYPIDDSFLFARSPTDEFWSGFDTSKWCLRLDDVAFLNPDKAMMDKTLEEILNVINNVPFNPPQAALEDKGRTPVRVELCIATTNTKDLNASAYFSCPLAILRRFPMVITLEVKREYCQDEIQIGEVTRASPFIDPQKLPENLDGWPNFWRIIVEKIVPDCAEGEGKDYAKIVPHKIFEDVNEFLVFFGQSILEHRRRQDNAMKSDKVMSTLTVCKNCLRTYTVHCDCQPLQVQSRDRIVSYCRTVFNFADDVCREIFIRNWLLIKIITISTHLVIFMLTWWQSLSQRLYYSWNGSHLIAESLCFSCWKPTSICECSLILQSHDSDDNFFHRNVAPRIICYSRRFYRFVSQSGIYAFNLILRAHTYYCCCSFTITLLKYAGRYQALRMLTSRFIVPFLESRQQLIILGEWCSVIKKKNIPRVLAALGLCLSLYATYNFVNKGKSDKDLNVQGDDNAQQIIDNRFEKEMSENVWYKKEVSLTSFDIPVPSRSLVKAPREQLIGMFQKNCVKLQVRFYCKERQVNIIKDICGVFVRGQYLLTNNHAFPELDLGEESKGKTYDVTIIMSDVSAGITPNVRFKLFPEDICRLPGNDLAMVLVRSVPPFKDILKYWTEKENGDVSLGFYLRRNEQGLIEDGVVRAATLQHIHLEQLQIDSMIYMAHIDTLTREGQCGSIFVNQSPRGPFIVGLHLLGRNNTAGYMSVTRPSIDRLISMCDDILGRMTICGGGEPMLNVSDSSFAISGLHYKSLVRYCEDGTANVYGTLKGFRVSPRSKVCLTPEHARVSSYFDYDVKHGPPSMKNWKPWRNNLLDMIHPNFQHSRCEIHTVAKSFLQDILRGLPHNWEKRLHKLTRYEAVNGIPGVKFIDSIKRSTSMGHPWCKTKKAFLISSPNELYPDGIDFSSDVWRRVDEMEAKYRNSERAYPIFTEHLKDEATSFAKISIDKTRAFSGAPVDMGLLVRQYFLSFVKMLQENKFVFEAAPGTNPASREWTQFYEYLTKHGAHKMIAGDYGKYDKKMISDFILEAFWIIIELHRLAGWSEEDLQVMWGLATDTAFPLINFNGDLLEFFGTNPSGHPLTVIINSLVNSLYMRWMYFRLNPQRECFSFKENVNLMTYGDDNIMGVSDAVPWFNHTSVQDELAKFGLVYTMPDKESLSVPYVHIDTCEFLKRKWRFDPILGYHACPLNLSSVLKSLTVWVPSSEICSEQQFVEVMVSANMEAFFHGRDVFDFYHKFFMNILEEDKYSVYLPNGLVSWDEFVQKFTE